VERGYSSVSDYDFKETAAFVDGHVRDAAHGIYFAAFYDPTVGMRDIDNTDQGPARDEHAQLIEAKRLLRAQVADFVEWLKAQGVI
jgi:hypothetical protein